MPFPGYTNQHGNIEIKDTFPFKSSSESLFLTTVGSLKKNNKLNPDLVQQATINKNRLIEAHCDAILFSSG